MNKRFSVVVAVLSLLFGGLSLEGQTQRYQTPLVWCGQDIFNTPENPASKVQFNWADHFVKLNRVGTIFMPDFGASPSKGDSMSRAYRADADLNEGDPWGADGWSETWYVPADPGTGKSALWRLYSHTYQDHMDSENPNEGSMYGYTSEGAVGYPWTSSALGRQPLARYYASPFDHRTERPNLTFSSVNADGQTLYYGQEFQWDNTSGRPSLYGYPRFGTRYDLMNWPSDGRCALLRDPATYQYQLDNGVIKVEFNRDWGNTIQNLYFDGRSVVAGLNIGYMMQGCLWIDAGHGGENPDYLLNPTESGGIDSFNPAHTYRWAGSPITSVTAPAAFNPASPAPITLTTTLRPLNFAFSSFYQTNQNETSGTQPLMWRGTFDRPTTLGYQSRVGYLNNVIKMGFAAQLDTDVPDKERYGNTHLNPTFWLYLHNFGTNGTATAPATNAQSSIRYSYYNIPANTDSAVTQGIGEQTRFGAATTNHAMIAYAFDGSFAVGILSKNVIGGQVYRQQSSVFCPECPPEEQILIMNVNDFQDMRTSKRYSDSYFVVGTLAQVKTSLRRIYCTETGTPCP